MNEVLMRSITETLDKSSALRRGASIRIVPPNAIQHMFQGAGHVIGEDGKSITAFTGHVMVPSIRISVRGEMPSEQDPRSLDYLCHLVKDFTFMENSLNDLIKDSLGEKTLLFWRVPEITQDYEEYGRYRHVSLVEELWVIVSDRTLSSQASAPKSPQWVDRNTGAVQYGVKIKATVSPAEPAPAPARKIRWS